MSSYNRLKVALAVYIKTTAEQYVIENRLALTRANHGVQEMKVSDDK